MYNGIGLSSVRGSATSGHVQANRSHVRDAQRRRQQARNLNSSSKKSTSIVSSAARNEGNREIQTHQAKREIENELLLLREDMEEAGQLSPAEIDERIHAERQRLLNRLGTKNNNSRHQGRNQNNYYNDDRHFDHNYNRRSGDFYRKPSQNHQHRARTTANHALKRKEDERLADALQIRPESHVEGVAFDQELQKQEKEDRKRERELQVDKQEEKQKKTSKMIKSEEKKTKTSGSKRKKYSDSSSGSGSSSDEGSSSSASSSYSSSSDESSRHRRRHRRRRSGSSSFSDSP
mmetsp:Transcript_20513/g.30454  ORF Transcript_20513/g.30454 Transcript_20513/m.30454 type:complete len:291 (-) Transcript_20513:22-894(-)|eukprot:CAMPEP_0194213940 /NCGR_PEP_ID=MMETSP0156-20130528/14888_1 /TAXON_ID=33649 /ORGANISM="Thalassionema nitzschioides, Strain L26-B" /LENGTH=290 /DNA_ID=CAMNT_0038942089 /DNA_START=169 /DNA_END=1044 /DNA_ORIENTATION=+